jgi:hypothetical protein
MDNNDNPQCREIGRGCCGSIWTVDDTDWVVKHEDCDTGLSVLNDHVMHRRVLSAIDQYGLPVRIPRSYEIIESSDDWWDSNLNRFETNPGHALQACRTYKQDRSPAIPQPMRELLITKYCRESLQAPTRASKNNEDCLIRIYTGKWRTSPGRPSMFFNLRNYGLCVDQMEEQGLPIWPIVESLAAALVHCYWKARVDANDVEFVLAPPTEPCNGSEPLFELEGQRLVIWMLDYDCVREISQDDNGVEQAVKAFSRNDPYFPRPFAQCQTSGDLQLCERFKAQFLECSKSFLHDRTELWTEGQELPKRWVALVEVEGERRRSQASSRSADS